MTPGGDDAQSVDLELVETAPATARRVAEEAVAHWSLDVDLDVLRLLVSEVVTNAVRYARDGGHLRLVLRRAPGVLRVEVHDGSALLPMVREAQDDEEGGRGTALMAALAARWDAEAHADGGKAVWFEVPSG